MLDVLCAVGGKGEQLGHGSNGFGRFKKCLAKAAPKRRSAGLASCQTLKALSAQIVGKHDQLRRFAAAVDAFQRDEFSFQDGCSGDGRRSCEMDEIACLKIKTSG